MAKTPEFTIPSLAEADKEYRELIERQVALNSRSAEIAREIAEVEAAIKAEASRPGPRLRAPIAELVGDADAAAVDRRRELRDLRQAADHHAEALAVIQRRVYDRVGVASRAVIAAVQGEINKRKAAVAAATQSALAAHADLEALLRDIEAEGAEADTLRGNVIPFFLTNGQAARYVAEHKDGGNG